MKNLFFGLIATVMFGFSANAANEIKEVEVKKEIITTVLEDTAPPRSIICWIVFIFSNDHCPG
jgi:hypothetical protein